MGKKKTIEDCYKLAEERGFTLLSTEYIRSDKPLLWRCAENHEWPASYNSIQQGRGCGYCYGNKPNTLEDCHRLAALYGGRFLSEEYINCMTKYKWECSKGHIWPSKYNDVQQGYWCPVCAPEKSRQTLLNKYGVENAFQSEEIKEKIKKTNIQKYGVEHASQSPAVALKTAKSLKNSFILHHWRTKEEVICTGSWEKKVVEYFNKNKINYLWQPKTFHIKEKNTSYRPDCYLPDLDLWVEIKGYFRGRAEEKWNWFHTTYPNSELWNKEKLKEMGIL
jgi:hypothetical protein